MCAPKNDNAGVAKLKTFDRKSRYSDFNFATGEDNGHSQTRYMVATKRRNVSQKGNTRLEKLSLVLLGAALI